MKKRDMVLRPYSEGGTWFPTTPLGGLRKRKRILRRLLRWSILMASLAGITLFGHSGWNLLRSDGVFTIRNIIIVGLVHHPAAPLLSALQDIRGRSLLKLAPSAISGRLRVFPWIRGFVCTRHLPDTLIVTVEERKGIAAVGTPGGAVEIDGRGGCWKAAPGTTCAFELGSGAEAGNGDVQKLVVRLLALGLSRRIKTIEGSGSERTFVLLTRNGWRLIVRAGDLSGEFKKYREARKWAETHNPPTRTMDLRWRGRVVFTSTVPGAVNVSSRMGGENG